MLRLALAMVHTWPLKRVRCVAIAADGFQTKSNKEKYPSMRSRRYYSIVLRGVLACVLSHPSDEIVFQLIWDARPRNLKTSTKKHRELAINGNLCGRGRVT